MVRKKSQHRKEVYGREKAAQKISEGAEPSTVKAKTQWIKLSKDADRTSQQQKVVANKLRPYLAVVVTNLMGCKDARKRVAMIASKVGPIKVHL